MSRSERGLQRPLYSGRRNSVRSKTQFQQRHFPYQNCILRDKAYFGAPASENKDLENKITPPDPQDTSKYARTPPDPKVVISLVQNGHISGCLGGVSLKSYKLFLRTL